ncbi:hypothetical protein HMPREF1322_0347 [Porphyromonas gingivalis W50]|nr:hypothetical protein HMPREF1322_0347 [Porphyromonas gingivalis W50]
MRFFSVNICSAFLFCGCTLYLTFSGCFVFSFFSVRIHLFGSLARAEQFGL